MFTLISSKLGCITKFGTSNISLVNKNQISLLPCKSIFSLSSVLFNRGIKIEKRLEQRYNHTPFASPPLKDPSHYNLTKIPKDQKVPLVDLNNKIVGEVALPWQIFQTPIRRDILHRVVVWQQAKTRQGTHSNLSKTEVSGTRRKARAQKGSGAARVGTIRAPQFRHGGRAFPVKPRDYEFSLPKKIRTLGLKVALSTKLAQGKLIIVDKLSMETHKTVDFIEIMKKMEWRKALLVYDEKFDKNIQLASRNLFWEVQSLPSIGLNVYSILAKDYLIISKDALDSITKRLLSEEEYKEKGYEIIPINSQMNISKETNSKVIKEKEVLV